MYIEMAKGSLMPQDFLKIFSWYILLGSLLLVAPMSMADNSGRGILSLPVLFYPDGTKLIGHNGDNSLTDNNNNGLFEVLPGDEITVDGITYTVPKLPGYPAGTPYEFDPTGPFIIGGSPQVIITPDGEYVDDEAAYLAGANGLLGDEDDIEFYPADPALDFDTLYHYLLLIANGAAINHRDGTALEGGATPQGSLIAAPDIILRPGSAAHLPAENIVPLTGRVRLLPGNTIDFDNDDLPPWEVTTPGHFDPATRLFYPDSDPEHPHVIPPPPMGMDNDPVIEDLMVGDAYITLLWPSYPSTGIFLSEIWAKVKLTDPQWEPLQDGMRGVVIDDDGASIPRNLESEMGGSSGFYRYFRRVIP